MKLLDDFSCTDFKKYSKNFNVNTFKQSRIVHKKGGCYCSKFLYQFIPFDSVEDIKKFEEKYNIKFTYCQNKECGFRK